MEFTGILKVILPEKSGISQKSGKPWKSQEIVVTLDHGRWTEGYVFSLFNKELEANVGDTVHVTFDGEAREHNGRYFNSLNVFKIERAPQASPAPVTPEPAAPSPFTPVQQPIPFTSGTTSGNKPADDDLPF